MIFSFSHLFPSRPSFPKEANVDSAILAAGRYGTPEMCALLGPEKTFETSLYVQGIAARVLSDLHPDIVPPEQAN